MTAYLQRTLREMDLSSSTSLILFRSLFWPGGLSKVHLFFVWNFYTSFFFCSNMEICVRSS